MAQYYTLEEASRKLGLSGDEFRKRLATEWKTLRRFPDGATLRFQSREIDELARSLGRGSDPELPVGEAPLTLAEAGPPSGGKKTADQKIYVPPSSDDFVPLALDENPNAGKSGKPGSDSDVKLEKSSGGVRPIADDATEEMDLPQETKKGKEVFEIKSDSSKKLSRKPGSDYDLSLDADSDDFDLKLTDDSDEVQIAKPSRKGPRAGDSGINLQDPADSGISLEKDDASEFELQLEPGPGSKNKKPTSSGKLRQSKPSTDKMSKPGSGKQAPTKHDTDSEFELTLDDSGESEVSATAYDAGEQKDIFETDFELPALDDSSGSGDRSGDNELENSDFDLSVDEDVGEDSASEVVAIEEEEIEDDLQPIEEEDEVRPVQAVVAAPKEWGVFPVAFMAPCVLVMFFVGIMGYELLHSMWGYHTQSKASGAIVRTIAEWFGELPKDS